MILVEIMVQYVPIKEDSEHESCLQIDTIFSYSLYVGLVLVMGAFVAVVCSWFISGMDALLMLWIFGGTFVFVFGGLIFLGVISDCVKPKK